MSDTPWTDGPWFEVEGEDGERLIADAVGDEIVCEVLGWFNARDPDANARLIKHSPQMIHFLEDLKQAHEERDDVEIPSDFWYDLLSLIGDIRDEELVA